MGWIDVLTDVVKGLRATGKNEKEIKAIVEQSADKATVNRIKQDSEVVISAAGRATLEAAVRRKSNNWRKMHRLSMRRKGGNRNGRAGSSHRY